MSDSHSGAGGHPNYLGIFWWLLALTIAEVIYANLALPALAMGGGLVAMAVTKAVLVAAYFMHLKFEKRTLAFIAVVPMILCVFLTLMLMPDASWSWRPH